jgi:ADP-heptose:LPS heptosyltransferase
MARLLVIQLDRLGDLIQSTPALGELAIEEVHADLLAVEGPASAIEGAPGVAELLTLGSGELGELTRALGATRRRGIDPPAGVARLIRELRSRRYAAVVNLSHGEPASWIAGQLRPTPVVGGALAEDGEWLCHGAAASYLLAATEHRRWNRLNLVDIYRAYVLSACSLCGSGARASDRRSLPRMHVALPPRGAAPAQRRMVAINPGASDPARRWPAGAFARLLALLDESGVASLLVGSRDDEPLCDEISRAAGLRDVPPVHCQLSVAEMAGLLWRSSLLVSNDTGAGHIAAAVGTPVLGLYGGPSWFAETAPWGAGHLVLQTPPGAPFDQGSLSPELVALTVLERLGLAGRTRLESALALEEVTAWETHWMPRSGSDPLGGVGFRPIGSSSTQEVPAGLRGAIARQLLGLREDTVDSEPIATNASEPVRLLAEAEAAALDGASENGAAKASADRLRALEAELARAVRETPGELVVASLSWRLRMIPPAGLAELFRAHADCYRAARAVIAEPDAIAARRTPQHQVPHLTLVARAR